MKITFQESLLIGPWVSIGLLGYGAWGLGAIGLWGWGGLGRWGKRPLDFLLAFPWQVPSLKLFNWLKV
jgi:hypothetical protein